MHLQAIIIDDMNKYDLTSECDTEEDETDNHTSDDDFDTSDCESESSSSDEDDSIAYRRKPRTKRCFHYIEREDRYCKKTPIFDSNYCSCHQRCHQR